MIYICIPSHNNDQTIGLLLWKIRKVFQEFPRQYHLLVADDGSTDRTAEILEQYRRSLPLDVIFNHERQGYPRSLEMLARETLQRSDRHKRDCAITLLPDFTVSPDGIPELIKRFESGADVIVGELDDEAAPISERIVRRMAPRLLRPGISLPGVADYTSGCGVFRLITLRRCFRDTDGDLLRAHGTGGHTELVARAASLARQIAAVNVPRGPGSQAGKSIRRVGTALEYFKLGRKLDLMVPEDEVRVAT